MRQSRAMSLIEAVANVAVGAGDADFMVKAKKRIAELVEKAEILVLASHDQTTLWQLCRRGLVFDHGHLVFDGEIDAALDAYRSRQVAAA